VTVTKDRPGTRPASGQTSSQRAGTASPSRRRNWSQRVTDTSNALDLEPGVFATSSAEAIARSLARSSRASTRREAGPYQSAMSMLNFYINRAGHNLSWKRRQILEDAECELRKQFGRAST
jgi:hypothetical protein